MKCIICEKPLTGRQTKFCSKRCKGLKRTKVYPKRNNALEELKTLLSLNAETGHKEFMEGLIDNNVQGLEAVAWHISDRGYIRTSTKHGFTPLHRIVLAIHGIDIPNGMQVDHINRNKLDNRLSNLRVVTPAQNNLNKPVASTKKASIYKGVHKTASGRWQAMIWHKGKNHGLGSYETPEEAAMVYDMKAKELYGDYAFINLIN